jgi:hypothetical protein
LISLQTLNPFWWVSDGYQRIFGRKNPRALGGGEQDYIFQKTPQVVALGECSYKYTTNLVPSNLFANE